MSEVMLLKTPAGALAPADEDARAAIARIKTGQAVNATIRRARNVAFHRKMFALFNLAFDVWEPEVTGSPVQYRGQPVAKDFERFRNDITILAGFYRSTYNIRGEVRLEPESLSFASMGADRFDAVYRAVLAVVWSRVLHAAGYADEAAVERVVAHLMEFE